MAPARSSQIIMDNLTLQICLYIRDKTNGNYLRSINGSVQSLGDSDVIEAIGKSRDSIIHKLAESEAMRAQAMANQV